MAHKSRLCYVTIDVNDLKKGMEFWSQALNAKPEAIGDISAAIYQRMTLPHSDLRVLLQKVDDKKTSKTRMHIDIETDDVDAEVERLKSLGATEQRQVRERGFSYSVMVDPFDNEFCVLQPEYPEMLDQGNSWQ